MNFFSAFSVVQIQLLTTPSLTIPIHGVFSTRFLSKQLGKYFPSHLYQLKLSYKFSTLPVLFSPAVSTIMDASHHFQLFVANIDPISVRIISIFPSKDCKFYTISNIQFQYHPVSIFKPTHHLTRY